MGWENEVGKLLINSSIFNVIENSIKTGGLPVHAALVRYHDMGLLFGGNCGSGKTTCTQRLPPEYTPLCDDLSIIEVINDNEMYVIPFPNWTEHLVEQSHLRSSQHDKQPLNTIFFLKKSRTTAVVRMTKNDAALRLTHLSCQICEYYWRIHKCLNVAEWRSKIFVNAWSIVDKIPCYILRSTLASEFWKEIEKVL